MNVEWELFEGWKVVDVGEGDVGNREWNGG